MKTKISLVALVLVAFTLVACGSASVNVNVNATANANTNANAEPAGTPADASAESQSSAGEALVADLYKQHDAKKSPFFQTKNRALLDKYFTKELADLIWKDATASKGEVGAIDGDPLYNAQDMEIKGFAIGKATMGPDIATVPVTFTNFGDKKTVTFSLKMENNAWKISNIGYGDGDSLLKWLQDTYPDSKTSSASGEFEGKYIVGETSCTVKPAKMSFDVSWQKGSGIEKYFFKDGTTFESNADSGRPDQFVFDDANYNSGTFYRADGKTFPVKRAK